MEQAARVAGVADTTADPVELPTRDIEIGLRNYNNSSRASLPLSHRRSFSSFGGRRSRSGSIRSSVYDATSHTADIQQYQTPSEYAGNAGHRRDSSQIRRNTDGLQDDDDDEDDPEEDPNEIPWGPSHPCFPHLNPHVPLDSPLYASTRIIRIKRDWMIAGDMAPTYASLYPEILDPVLPEETFRELITHINGALIRAFNPWRVRSWIDAGLGLATGWLWDDLGLTGVKRELRALEKYIEQWNADYGTVEGVTLIPLRRTAFLTLDIQIPDPQVALVGDDETEADVDMDGASRASSRNGVAGPPGVRNGPPSAAHAARRAGQGPPSITATSDAGGRSAYSYRLGGASAQQGGHRRSNSLGRSSVHSNRTSLRSWRSRGRRPAAPSSGAAGGAAAMSSQSVPVPTTTPEPEYGAYPVPTIPGRYLQQQGGQAGRDSRASQEARAGSAASDRV